MILIKKAEVFAPGAMGRRDILTGGGKILAIEKSVQAGGLPGEVDVIDRPGTGGDAGLCRRASAFHRRRRRGGLSHPHPGDAAQHEHD